MKESQRLFCCSFVCCCDIIPRCIVFRHDKIIPHTCHLTSTSLMPYCHQQSVPSSDLGILGLWIKTDSAEIWRNILGVKHAYSLLSRSQLVWNKHSIFCFTPSPSTQADPANLTHIGGILHQNSEPAALTYGVWRGRLEHIGVRALKEVRNCP